MTQADGYAVIERTGICKPALSINTANRRLLGFPVPAAVRAQWLGVADRNVIVSPVTEFIHGHPSTDHSTPISKASRFLTRSIFCRWGWQKFRVRLTVSLWCLRFTRCRWNPQFSTQKEKDYDY